MEIRNTLAIVDDACFYTGQSIFEHSVRDLASLLSEADKRGFTHVWVLAGSRLSRLYSLPGECPGWQIDAIYQNKKKDRYNFLRARRPGWRHEQNIYVSFPEYSWWPWEGDDSPKVLLATVASLEEGLQLHLEWSPPHMSEAYTRRENDGHRFWLKAPTINLEQHGFSYGQVEEELHWPPEGYQVAIDPGATHEVEMDGNSAYAAGMTGLNVGEGDPEWIGMEDFTHNANIYDGKRPGFWHIRRCIKNDSIFDGKDLPSFENREWMSTDLIEQLRAVGYVIAVDSGWIWRRYHQALRSTATNLWKLRVHWRELSRQKPDSKTCGNVHETLRVIIKAVHGRQPPAIRAMVVARSVAMMVYRIGAIYRKYGVKPRMIKVDGLKYAVSDAHLFDEMLSDKKLGGFKHVATVEIQKIHRVSK